MPSGSRTPARGMPSMHTTFVGSSSGINSISQPMLEARLVPIELNPNFDTNNHNGILEDFGSPKSSSENLNGEGVSPGDDNNNNEQPGRAKRKRYHRHTLHQIQEMEAFFKECPHPDDKQRKQLSRDLGLEPLQVKFWFQNKRTQQKTHQERCENTALRMENDKLRTDNMRYREALGNISCPTCGGPATIGEITFDEHNLRVENVRLREELDRMSAIAAKYVGRPPLNFGAVRASPASLPQMLENGTASYGGGDLGRSFNGSPEKSMIVELAVAALDEFVQMAQRDGPLWHPSPDGTKAVLNQDEYLRVFAHGTGPRPAGYSSEASRDSAVVIMNHISLLEILMDVNQWATMFTGIVSKAATLDVLSTGVPGNFNGALQVMSAEFQVPSPLVPTRDFYFIRYCKELGDGTWAVVDVSLHNLPSNANQNVRCRRRPSGCMIQEMPNGYSKVTWVENVDVDDSEVHHIYRQFINSGCGFGAMRWVATLERQCERLASLMATNIPAGDVGVIANPLGRKSMLKLAERMVVSFNTGVSATVTHTWTTLSGGPEDVRVMTRKSVDDPGRPPGIVLSAATSFWLPASPKRVFNFLRDENLRKEWDILSNGGIVQEMAHIANGRDTGNSVSLLRVNNANPTQSNMLIIQETCTDPTGSFVIFAPVDINAMNVVLNGGDPDYVALLPSGFAILPDGTPPVAGMGASESGGTLLTVAFQILVDSVPTAKLSLGSVATVNNLINLTAERLRGALGTIEAAN